LFQDLLPLLCFQPLLRRRRDSLRIR
jgi:hypothetical protein